MHKTFSFRGISRSTDNMSVQDGDCLELLNLKNKNGSTVPVAPPQVIANLPYRYSAVYRHEAASKYLCITAGEGRVHLLDDGFAPIEGRPLELSPHCAGVGRIEFVGNVVCLLADSSIMYALYDTDDYKWLGERPQMPAMSVAVESQLVKLTTDDKYYTGVPVDDEKLEQYWSHAAKGYIDECVAKLNERGCFVDRVLLRCAFRLYDGSYICFSPIYYVEDMNSVEGCKKDDGNMRTTALAPGSTTSKYTVEVQGFKPVVTFGEFNLDAWENIIVSLDVFASGSIPGHRVSDKPFLLDGTINNVYEIELSNYDRYLVKTTGEIYSDVSSHSMFYKIAEYNLEGRCVEKLDNVSSEGLVLSATLKDENVSFATVSAKYSYVFNGRLHLANLRERLFDGYDAFCYAPPGYPVRNVSAVLVTEVRTTRNTALLKKEYKGDFSVGCIDGRYFLTPLLQHPDTRAAALTFIIEIDGVKYRRRFELQPHPLLDSAVYLHDVNKGMLVIAVADFTRSGAKLLRVNEGNLRKFFPVAGNYVLSYTADGRWVCDGRTFEIPGESADDNFYNTIFVEGTPVVDDKLYVYIIESSAEKYGRKIGLIEIGKEWETVDSLGDDILPVNSVEVRDNVLKVSEVDNPFSFPAKQTYAPSNRAIVAMCSNTVALSQGQFGQHPLYLFCADGIWAMSVDASGGLAYTSHYPLAREVCVNGDTVCGIDSGVVFASSKGLLMVSGGNIAPLSASINEAEYKGRALPQGSVLRSIASLVSLQNLFSDDAFVDYLSGAKVGFVYARRELVVSNSSYPYSYLLSLEGGQWSKITHCFDAFVNSYPDFMALAHSGDNSLLLGWDEKSAGCTAFFLVTRPMMWGSKLHKRIMQLVLHATVVVGEGGEAFKGLACYLLGSNDGENFKLVSGSERRRDFCDLSFPYVPTQSYRYFSVAVVGNISSRSSIAAVELNVDAAWNNGLN
ncbi:MAG: hypothetical protein IKZ37_07760 [Bacteroidaceae bacterium]|nr:hypothetical protein [Bacteroidaceae bacterium]